MVLTTKNDNNFEELLRFTEDNLRLVHAYNQHDPYNGCLRGYSLTKHRFLKQEENYDPLTCQLPMISVGDSIEEFKQNILNRISYIYKLTVGTNFDDPFDLLNALCELRISPADLGMTTFKLIFKRHPQQNYERLDFNRNDTDGANIDENDFFRDMFSQFSHSDSETVYDVLDSVAKQDFSQVEIPLVSSAYFITNLNKVLDESIRDDTKCNAIIEKYALQRINHSKINYDDLIELTDCIPLKTPSIIQWVKNNFEAILNQESNLNLSFADLGKFFENYPIDKQVKADVLTRLINNHNVSVPFESATDVLESLNNIDHKIYDEIKVELTFNKDFLNLYNFHGDIFNLAGVRFVPEDSNIVAQHIWISKKSKQVIEGRIEESENKIRLSKLLDEDPSKTDIQKYKDTKFYLEKFLKNVEVRPVSNSNLQFSYYVQDEDLPF